MKLLVAGGAIVATYVSMAYVVLPAAWRHYEHQPGLAERPMVTRTANGIPGDPLNIGLIGDQDDVILAFKAAGWFPADPITFRSSAAIIGSVLLSRRYETAPVSPLFYDGRRQDLAYERSVGRSARQRHHVRLWKVMERGAEGRPVWLGGATFDKSVWVSHYTGQVTHAIAPDIDAERDFLAKDFETAGMVTTVYEISGVGPTLDGRNGEGSLYRTDGEIRMLVLVENGERHIGPPEELSSPPLVEVKNAIWDAVVPD